MDTSFLPDIKYHNFAWAQVNEQGVSKDLTTFECGEYYDYDITRYKCVIGDQLDLIKNKRVLDIGCNVGIFSLLCLHNDAAHVTGIDIREKELEVAAKVCNLAGYNNFDFQFLNIYETEKLTELCNTVDTVIMSGVFYHVNHHVKLIEAISNSNVRNIIIESEISLENSIIPTLSWRIDDSSNPSNGMEKDNKFRKVFVGIPNRRFIESILMYTNYKVVYNRQFDYLKNDDGTMRDTCVVVGSKDYQEFDNWLIK